MGKALAFVGCRFALLAALAGTWSRVEAQPVFEAGDLCLVSMCLPNGAGGCESGVLRIRGGDWSVERLVTLPIQDACQRGAYDAHRDGLVIGGPHLYLVRADGSYAQIDSLGGVTGIAPKGDGLVYFCASSWVYVLDAGNTRHFLLDAAGAPVQIFDVYSLWYDAASGSLLVGRAGNETTVQRLPLSADGMSLAGAPVSSSYDTSPGSSESPVAMSAGPGGSVFVKVDDNTNNQVPRMLLLDAATMNFSVYAWDQYFGVAGETSGAYSSDVGGALVVDTMTDFLRLYHQGDSGEGSGWLGDGISGPGAGEWCQLFVVERNSCAGDFNHDGFVNGDDYDAFAELFESGDLGADINGDGFVNGDDFDYFAGHFEAGC